MKKIIVMALIFSIFGSIFASTYKVNSVVGNVSVETKDGFKSIEVGQEILGVETIKVGINSSLILEDEKGVKRTIKSTSRGSAEDLFISAFSSKGTLKKAKIVSSNVPEVVESNRKGVATASSRASEAKADFDWDE